MKHIILCLALAATAPAFAKDAHMDLTPDWEYVADTVMGGVSTGQITREEIAGCTATRLTGQVSLDNNGGFVQMAADMKPDGSAMDASAYSGVEIEVIGNGEVYDLRLRTDALSRPWQSFRTDFTAPAEWTTVRVPFEQIVPHKTDARFDPAALRRIGILAIGREFAADVAICAMRLYR